MSKFFDTRTRQLHEVSSYAGAVKIPKEIVAAPTTIKCDTTSRLKALGELRHFNTCYDLSKLSSFFSTKERRVLVGGFTLEHPSNKDLISVDSTIIYK